MKAKDLALKLLENDRGGDDVFFRIDLDGDSYFLEPGGVTRVNGDKIGVLLKSTTEVTLEELTR